MASFLGAQPVVAEVVRNGMVESVHHGIVVGLDAAGEIALQIGDVEQMQWKDYAPIQKNVSTCIDDKKLESPVCQKVARLLLFMLKVYTTMACRSRRVPVRSGMSKRA